jgi:translation elongation factor EF-1beta
LYGVLNVGAINIKMNVNKLLKKIDNKEQRDIVGKILLCDIGFGPCSYKYNTGYDDGTDEYEEIIRKFDTYQHVPQLEIKYYKTHNNVWGSFIRVGVREIMKFDKMPLTNVTFGEMYFYGRMKEVLYKFPKVRDLELGDCDIKIIPSIDTLETLIVGKCKLLKTIETQKNLSELTLDMCENVRTIETQPKLKTLQIQFGRISVPYLVRIDVPKLQKLVVDTPVKPRRLSANGDIGWDVRPWKKYTLYNYARQFLYDITSRVDKILNDIYFRNLSKRVQAFHLHNWYRLRCKVYHKLGNGVDFIKRKYECDVVVHCY